MDSFSLASNLRMSFKASGFPKSLQLLEEYVSQCFDYDIRGTLLEYLGWSMDVDLVEPTAGHTMKGAQDCEFKRDVYDALCQYCAVQGIPLAFDLKPCGLHLQDISHNQIHYIADRHHGQQSLSEGTPILSLPPKGDSQVMITSGHISHQPAIIKDIVELALPGRKVQRYLAIQWWLPAVDSVVDMFRKYPILKASLWRNTFGDLKIVHAEDMCGPYASCVIDDQHSSVVSLYQVSGTCLTSMSRVLTAPQNGTNVS